MKQQSIIHLFPRRSLMNEDIIQQDSSDMKITSRKFSYKKMCAQCIPNSIRSDQEKNQEINLNLLYTYDPFQIEVRYSPLEEFTVNVMTNVVKILSPSIVDIDLYEVVKKKKDKAIVIWIYFSKI